MCSGSSAQYDVTCLCAAAVDRIKADLLTGAGRGQSYERLARFVDESGSRFAGSDSLERAIDDTVAALSAEGFANVHTEPVMVSSTKVQVFNYVVFEADLSFG